jgi:hypothetical protein
MLAGSHQWVRRRGPVASGGWDGSGCIALSPACPVRAWRQYESRGGDSEYCCSCVEAIVVVVLGSPMRWSTVQ